MNSSFVQNRWFFPLVLVLTAALVGLSTLLTPPGSNQEPLPNRSIYNSAPSGYRAWWLSCQKAGLGIVPWEKPFSKLETLPESATMLIVQPLTFSKSNVLFGQQEANLTLSWVAQGNTLVLLDDFGRFGSKRLAEEVLQTVHKPRMPKSVSDSGAESNARQAMTTMWNLEKDLNIYTPLPLSSQSGEWLIPKNHALEVSAWEPILLNKAGHPVLVRIAYGKGTLILGTVSDMGDNSYLNGKPNDNYQFLANLLRREGKLIFVNEYVHAYEEAEDLLSYLGQNTPLGVIFVQLTLGFILLLWLSLTQWTPKPKGDNPAAALAETNSLEAYVQSMARIYARTQASSLALGPQLNRLELLMRQRFRLTLEDEARLKHLLGTSPGDYSSKDDSPESLVAALRQARLVVQGQGRLTHKELLRLSRQLTVIEEKLQYERHRTHVLPR